MTSKQALLNIKNTLVNCEARPDYAFKIIEKDIALLEVLKSLIVFDSVGNPLIRSFNSETQRKVKELLK